MLGSSDAHTLNAVISQQYPESFAGKKVFENNAKLLLVVDDQNSRHSMSGVGTHLNEVSWQKCDDGIFVSRRDHG